MVGSHPSPTISHASAGIFRLRLQLISFAVGGNIAIFDGFWDVLPLSLVWFLLMASVTWGALQLYVGARLLGPLGICMAWAIYQVS